MILQIVQRVLKRGVVFVGLPEGKLCLLFLYLPGVESVFVSHGFAGEKIMQGKEPSETRVLAVVLKRIFQQIAQNAQPSFFLVRGDVQGGGHEATEKHELVGRRERPFAAEAEQIRVGSAVIEQGNFSRNGQRVAGSAGKELDKERSDAFPFRENELVQRIQHPHHKFEIVACRAESLSARGKGGAHTGEQVAFCDFRAGQEHARDKVEKAGHALVGGLCRMFVVIPGGKAAPEHVEPVVVQLAGDVVGAVRVCFPEPRQKLRLEVFPFRELFPRAFIVMKMSSALLPSLLRRAK